MTGFDGEVAADEAGAAYTQAGGHPYAASTTISFKRTRSETQVFPPLDIFLPDDDVKNIGVDLPPGFIGNPQATPTRCTEDELLKDIVACPPSSQVGVASIVGPFSVFAGPAVVGVYNMVPADDVPAAFAFNVLGVPVHLTAEVRSGGDYGLTVKVNNVSQGVAVLDTRLTFWGVPADPRHDAQRCAALDSSGAIPVCEGGPTSAGVEPRAFLTNPTRCTPPGVGLETRLSVDSWTGATDASSFMSHLPAPNQTTQQGPENCDRVPFDATLTARPVHGRAAEPAGYSFVLRIPQSDNPNAIGQAHLKRAVVTLPTGVSVSPSAADGLGACAAERIRLGTADEPNCPDASKVGSVEIDTPLLEEPMTGAVYLARPRSNPFNTLLALYLVARGPGVVVKLPGRVDANPATGQLIATFDNNPQLPFETLRIDFKSGPRAALTNPRACGEYTTVAELTAWTEKVSTSRSTFAITRDGNGAPCPPVGFAPAFTAGSTSDDAGGRTRFTLSFSRADYEQTFRTVDVSMPRGLLATIRDVPMCPEALAASGGCSETSRIGAVTTGSGSGGQPLFLPGRVYLGGPYNGAPLSLSIVVPAVAGPFDLGTVVVRAAVFVNRATAELSVVADPLPTILEGIPLLIRSVTVELNKPDFMVNPTSCEAKAIGARLGSMEGATSAPRAPFKVSGCGDLRFRPRMTLRVGARGRVRAGITTPLVVTLTQARGEANNRSVEVTLPKALNSRLRVVTDACTLEQFRTGRCTKAVGSGVAETPLLKEPLKGKAYFVRNPARRLPDLMVALRGQVDIDLVGKVTIPRDLTLRTTFDTVPDAPISKFTLSFVAGRRGPVGIVRGLCQRRTRRTLAARVAFKAHSGHVVRGTRRLQVAGCGRARKR